MYYEEVRPGPPLRSHIECFWFLSDGTLAEPREIERIVPVGRCEQPDWADVAAGCSYFDRPHLIRDFRALTGETPSEFVRNQGRMSMNFTDPARLAGLLGGA